MQLLADSKPQISGNNSQTQSCDTADRRVDSIQIHVIGWRRPRLKLLLEMLEEADYSGWNSSVPFYIHLDGGAFSEVIAASEEFRWSNGKKNLDIRLDNVGLREMWLSSIGSAAKTAGNNTLMVIFEDDMVVSLRYFQWLLAAVDAYGRNPDCRNPSLMGFSLSPIRKNEMEYPFARWDARAEIRAISYLSVLPSSWGVAYWSDRWNEFSKFVNSRMQQPYYNMQNEKLVGVPYDRLRLTPREFLIPNARSNFWTKSWKRFMIDWMYGRGLVMASFVLSTYSVLLFAHNSLSS